MSVHQLTIGDIECAVLHEGSAKMTVDSIAARYPECKPVRYQSGARRRATIRQP